MSARSMVDSLRDSPQDEARVEELFRLAGRIADILDRAAFEEVWTVRCEEEYCRLTGFVRNSEADD